MKFSLRYGHGQVELNVPERNFAGELRPRIVGGGREEDIVAAALASPIGSPRLREIVRPGEKICVVASDVTRPCPSHRLLPPLLAELNAAGIPDRDVVIVLALGIHRFHAPEEQKKLVGPDIYDRCLVVDHDPARCRRLGTTAAGTPADVFETVVEADRRICLGNVEYHYFAGYSGGAKAIMPGTSSHEAIQNNHKMMTLEAAKAGRLEDNPVRRDIDAVADFLSVDFILNVVLDEDKKIRAAFSGHYLEAHRAACRRLDEMLQVVIPPPGADIVAVSAGGHPKDINVYQAQKALDNAARAVRPGGAVIWIGACDEGFGESVFEKWLKEAERSSDLVERVKKDFRLGGHKAAAIAMVLEKMSVFMVSNLDPSVAKSLFVRPAPSPDAALAEALKELGPDSKVMVMPFGGSTLPTIAG
ncbi:MAG: nickel-dependent lactate racemase [Deltaproteobacteria bacterium]|jgi:nickel-dependent lactate racemase|nr:nickel-dependent lactate racemase [Deltaproteobacteria bacterium]